MHPENIARIQVEVTAEAEVIPAEEMAQHAAEDAGED